VAVRKKQNVDVLSLCIDVFYNRGEVVEKQIVERWKWGGGRLSEERNGRTSSADKMYNNGVYPRMGQKKKHKTVR